MKRRVPGLLFLFRFEKLAQVRRIERRLAGKFVSHLLLERIQSRLVAEIVAQLPQRVHDLPRTAALTTASAGRGQHGDST